MKRLLPVLSTCLLLALSVPLQAQTTADSESEIMQGFARAVAVSNGVVFVGEPANFHQPGVVYVFTKSGGEWSQDTYFMASDGKISDGFGSALSAEGNKVLVGAPNANDGNGAVYLFEQSDSGEWIENAAISLSGDSTQYGLGQSVLLDGNTAYIGAPGHSDGLGAVFEYKKTGEGVWVETASIVNPDTASSNFGAELAMEGSTLIVGAPERRGGSVHVFNSDEGEWKHDATLRSNQLNEQVQFGASIKVQGDKILVGAARYARGSGAVVVFTRNEESGTWEESARLMAFDGRQGYLFGSSIEIVDSNVWITAPNANEQMGTIYKYEMDENGMWTGASKLPVTGEAGALFGSTLAVEDGIAIAGMSRADYGAGAAAILEKDNSGSWVSSSVIIGEKESALNPITDRKLDCQNGGADIFGCENVDLLSFLPVSAIGGDRGVRLNDIWGWADPETGKEYALVGRNEGTSFVDVTDPVNPVYVGNLPMTEGARANVWRDIKVYKNHAYIVADGAGEHGMQVLDLTQLREFDGEPILFEETAHYDKIHSAHNVVINEDTGFAYIVGSSGGGETCGGGLHMVDITEPTNPAFAGCFADPSTGRSGTGYSHDAQCVIYQGPDEEHQGEEICIGSNETAISIAKVSDKGNPVALSTASYPDYGYVHQGWLTEDHRYFFQNDELDELTGKVDQTRTIVWDLTDLDDPQFLREFLLDNPSSDHNLYIKDNVMYQSNYVSGLQVIDVSDPANPKKVGHFDTHPFVEDAAGFSGTWSNYPYFESGIVIMTSGQEGLFVLQPKENPLNQ